jgi:hypothetical protein
MLYELAPLLPAEHGIDVNSGVPDLDTLHVVLNQKPLSGTT